MILEGNMKELKCEKGGNYETWKQQAGWKTKQKFLKLLECCERICKINVHEKFSLYVLSPTFDARLLETWRLKLHLHDLVVQEVSIGNVLHTHGNVV